MDKRIQLFLRKLKEMPDFDKVKFVFLFGSVAGGKQNKLSDIDFAVYYDGNGKERFKFRLKILTKLPDNFDVQIFQDLPLYIRKEVLKGNLIYTKDKLFVYDVAYDTIKRFDDFIEYYQDYLETKKLRI